MAQIAYLNAQMRRTYQRRAGRKTICPKDGGSLYVRFDLAALKASSRRIRYADARHHVALP